MRKVCLRTLLLLACLGGFLGTSFRSAAQSYQVLVDWDNTWFYDQSGRELLTAWRAVNYVPDGFWGQGPGLLGLEDTTVYPQPIQTPLQLQITNTYLRTSFTFNGSTAGLVLGCTNLIDDGAVIYLNGTEVGRFRVPANQNAATFGGDQTAEGTYDTLIITNVALLRSGLNVVAVEVHQASFTSSDIVYGMQLVAIRSAPLSIVTQPQSQFPVVGDTWSLFVEVAGGPVTYRWYKDGVLNTQQTNSIWNMTAATATQNGNYFATVSNIFGVVTSSVAKVTVIPDTVGPRVIDATVDTNTYARFGAQTIAISFSETVNTALSTNPANFTVYFGTNYASKVTFTNVTPVFTTRPQIHLWMSGPNWKLGSNYWVLINNVYDQRATNQIASNVRVPVGWQIVSNLTSMTDNWLFHAAYDFENDIYSTSPPWYATNYTSTSVWWAPGHGIFYFDPDSTGLLCSGDSFGSLISFQQPPTLFRRTFNVPAGLSLSGALRLRYIIDDGMVLYLNGKDVHEYNSNPGPVSANSQAKSSVNGVCTTNVTLNVSNLFPGLNYMAAAVVQSAPGDAADTIFGLEMDYVSTQVSVMPPDPPTNQCRLTMTKVGQNVRLTWDTNFSGMFLQYKTNMDTKLPWLTSSVQSNGLVVPYVGQTRLWRLYNYK